MHALQFYLRSTTFNTVIVLPRVYRPEVGRGYVITSNKGVIVLRVTIYIKIIIISYGLLLYRHSKPDSVKVSPLYIAEKSSNCS